MISLREQILRSQSDELDLLPRTDRHLFAEFGPSVDVDVGIGALAPADRQVEGVVEMILNAMTNSGGVMTAQRLKGWQASLFPTDYSGLVKKSHR